jgi:tRNA splicing ligase
VIDQLMQRYHYGSVASLLSEPAELINDFLEIMSTEGKLEAEERRKAGEAQRRRG